MHLAPDGQPHQHPPPSQFFTDQMPFLLPNQHHQSTTAEHWHKTFAIIIAEMPHTAA